MIAYCKHTYYVETSNISKFQTILNINRFGKASQTSNLCRWASPVDGKHGNTSCDCREGDCGPNMLTTFWPFRASCLHPSPVTNENCFVDWTLTKSWLQIKEAPTSQNKKLRSLQGEFWSDHISIRRSWKWISSIVFAALTGLTTCVDSIELDTKVNQSQRVQFDDGQKSAVK